MQRKITYKCELCGVEFDSKRDCQLHELKCLNRSFYISQEKERLKRYISFIENKGFSVSIRYDSQSPSTSGKPLCLISIVDVSHKKIKRR